MNKTTIISVILASLALCGVEGCAAQKSDTELAVAAAGPVTITAKEAWSLCFTNKGKPDFVILDVRSPEEVAEGKVEGATNINFWDEDFDKKLATLNPSNTYFVYCKSGFRSGGTKDKLIKLGFTKIFNLDGGITSWKAEKLPVVK